MFVDHSEEKGTTFLSSRKKPPPNRMILYDSHRWRTLVKLRGSILPKAFWYALLPACAAFGLTYAKENNHIDLPQTILTNPAAFSNFSWTVGFLLVFRTSQCYTRFWACATGASNIRAEIYDSCASLVAFCSVSKSSAEEVKAFKLKIIQLFSCFHATAMTSLSNQSQCKSPVLCADHMPKEFMTFLESVPGEKRVEVVYQWICTLVMNEHDHGVLHNTPPPIMNGVFVELSKTMREYITILQVITLPFPFPYSQACLVMIILYMIGLPFVMTTWTKEPVAAFAYTFASAMCFWSLELIAAELENPFGDDVNDLPVLAFQEDVNEGLLLLVHPQTDALYDLDDESARTVGRNWCTIDSKGISIDEELMAVEETLEEVARSQEHQVGEKNKRQAAEKGVDPQKSGGSGTSQTAKPAKVGTHLAHGNGNSVRPAGLDIDSLALDISSLAIIVEQSRRPPQPVVSEQTCKPPPAPSPREALLDVSWVERFMEQQRNLNADLLNHLDGIARMLSSTAPPYTGAQSKHTDASGAQSSSRPDPLHDRL